MSPPPMHDDEVPIDTELVRRLVSLQFPAWSDLEVVAVDSSGTDNALYRLGDELAVRLPRIEWAVDGVDREQTWVPRLAPHLPLAVPAPVIRGEPAGGYPWPWSVCRWLSGVNPVVGRLEDAGALARALAGFVAALHAAPAMGGPSGRRGEPLAERDERTRAAIAALEGEVDTRAVTALWETALTAPLWADPPVWTHGDLASGNLLLTAGRLSGVIDFGLAGLGDPACDLLPAWNLFPPEARAVYRDGLGVDEATWVRGQGWALSVAVVQLPYYRERNRPLAENARHALAALLGGA